MIKWLKRIICKHEKVIPCGSDLIRQDDGSWITVHRWKCRKCGKVIENETT